MKHEPLHWELEYLKKNPNDIDQFRTILDETLQSLNSDYEAKRYNNMTLNPPKIILTTSDSNFAIQAFEYDCIIDYLVKPIAPERFQKAILKAESPPSVKKPSVESSTEKVETTSGNDLYVNINRRLIKIDISSILFVEAKGDYIHVKIEDKNYTLHSTLK